MIGYPRQPLRRGRGGTLLGIVIGLVLGFGISLGVAWYVNRSLPEGFTPKSATSPPPAAPEQAMTAPAQAPTGAEPTTAEEKARFEFYNILPGNEDKRAETPAPVAAAPALPSEKLYLQVGAFQNAADADNLKAKLALMGIEALVQQTHLPDKGDIHRVRIGPYASVQELGPVRASLARQGVEASLVRVPAGDNP